MSTAKMTSQIAPSVICPTCKHECANGGRLPCERRGCPCHVDAGVLCVGNSEVRFGEAQPEEMREVLSLARRIGWRDAIAQWFVGDRAFVSDLVFDRRRTMFSELLDLKGSENVLDLGCGYGGIAMQLANKVRSVTAVDITLERVALLALAKQQDNIENISTLCNSDVCHLPFDDKSFDIIIMVGVFEYFPKSLPQYSVVEAHARSLREIGRVLKPGGKLYLGTKNRFGWQFLLGARDHNDVPFGPVLPISLADWLCRRLNGTPYRVISHSYRGYTRLLRENGFSEVAMYWPVPGYQAPRSILPLNEPKALRHGVHANVASSIKRSLLSVLAATDILRFVVPDFSVVATKGSG